MRKQWILTQQHFDILVDWLGPDREISGVKYECIRETLIHLFIWNHCSNPEDLADDTIDRVIRKLPQVKPSYTGDPALYFYGVARKIILEQRRLKPPPEQLPRSEPIFVEPQSSDSEQKHDCLEECVKTLAEENRKLILKYYQEAKSKSDFRKEIAQQMGMDINNLRVRVHRIRDSLHKCIKKCLDEMASVQ